MNLYVAREGETDGPFSEEEIRSYIQSGLLPKDVLVCPEGESRWRNLPEKLPTYQVDEFGEVTLYKNRGVTVTRSRFVVGNQTYAIRNITSVQVAEVPRPAGCVLFLLIGGLLVGFLGLAAENAFIGCGGLVLIIGSIWALAARKPLYAVALNTSGGELRAITDEDQSFVKEVVAAMTKAIVSP